MSDKLQVKPRRIGILLVDGFTLLGYASIIEPFAAANEISGRQLYEWIHISVDGAPVTASNGAQIIADAAAGDEVSIDTIFVIVGGNPTTFSDRRTFNWLRLLAVSGVRIAGVSAGSFLLARAGLLKGYRCTIHWYYVPVFTEWFPTHLLESRLYVVDRNRMTCAGGTAGLDLAIDMVERDHGHDLATEMSGWFIRTQPRPADDAQRMSLRERFNVSNQRLLRTLAHMEATVEEPETREQLSRVAGVSPRQLERLFRTHMSSTINEVYRRIRLDFARALIRKTSLSITNVAIAAGFTSTSHFSRSYSEYFGHSPRKGRQQWLSRHRDEATRSGDTISRLT